MQMECCDIEVCDFVQYRPFGHRGQGEEFMITEIKRDREWWAKHFPLFQEFHEQVQDYKKNGERVLTL